MNTNEMIHFKDQRIIFTLGKVAYDITDCIAELIEELGKLKTR